MRAAVVAAILFLLFLIPAYAMVFEAVPRTYSAYGTFETTPCEECPNFENYEYPFMFSTVDVEERAATYSMAVSREGRREPVEGATFFVQIYDSNWEVLGRCRLYTDESGTATLDYSDYMRGARNCSGGCVARASFCCGNPVALKCTIANCLGEELGGYSDYPPSYPPCNGYDGPWPAYAAVGGTEYAILPASTDAQIPAEQETLPLTLGFSLCFPLTVIFGLLAAAMYASGRDPFAMFSFYTPRYTRGYERPMGARGFTLPGSGILSAISGIVKASAGGGGKGKAAAGSGKNVAATPRAGGAAAVKGQPGGVRMAAGTGERIVAQPRAAARPGAEPEAARPGARPEGRITSPQAGAGGGVESAAERAAMARMGGPISMLVRAMFGDETSWEALKSMFREFRPDVAGGATGETQYFKIGFGEFLLEMTSTILIYSGLPLFATNLIAQGFALAAAPLAGARNLENMDHDVEMLRSVHQNADGTVTVTYTDVYGNKSTETFERGSARFANFMTDMKQRYDSAVEFNNAAIHDSDAGLSQSSHDALSGDESRGVVVGGLVEGRGMGEEEKAIWLSPTAENLGAALDRHLAPEISANISIVLTNKNADGTVATAEQRAAAVAFVQENREGINAALSAVLLFANRGGDISAVKDNAAVSALLGLVGASGAVEGWHQAGWLLTDANGKIDLTTFNSLGMLAATLRASDDSAMQGAGARVELLLSNAIDSAKQSANGDASQVFSGGTETERRAAQLVIGELMYQSDFYVSGEGGSANGRFADIGHYGVGELYGSIRDKETLEECTLQYDDLSGDSLEQFKAGYSRFEGFAEMASAMAAGLAAPPAEATGADAIFGVASAWMEQRGTALEAFGQLLPMEDVIKSMHTEALYDNPAIRDILSPVVGGREERDATLNGLWDQVIDPKEERDVRQAIAVTHDPTATMDELAWAADTLAQTVGLPMSRQDFMIIASQSSSSEEVKDALARIKPEAGVGSMTEADVARIREETLRAYDMRITASSEDLEKQATLAFNPFLEQAVKGMVPQYEATRRQDMNAEAGTAFDVLQGAVEARGGEISLAPQEYKDSVELARNLFSFDGVVDAREQKVLDALSNPSSTQDELRDAVDYVGNRFYMDHSTMGQRDAYTTLINEDATRQEQNKAAEALTAAARVDWDALQQPLTMTPYEAIGVRDAQLRAPGTSEEDKIRLQQEIDYIKEADKALRDAQAQIAQPGTSAEDLARLQREIAITQQTFMYAGIGDGKSPLDTYLPQQGTFTDLTRRTVEGYFDGPLGRDAMEHQQQTLDQFNMLNPQLAVFKAETTELNPESQRIEDREMEQERKTEEERGRRRRGGGTSGQPEA
ncbi:MAG: hypothetical protein WC350_00820 [Candidatus Micrarchaeia archaeon]